MSECTVGPNKKSAEQILSISNASDVVLGVAEGFRSHAKDLSQYHLVIHLDWCNSLFDEGPTSWWNVDDGLSRGLARALAGLEEVTVIGWRAAANMVDGTAEIAWLGSHQELLSDEALQAFSQCSPIRCLRFKRGKLAAVREFPK